MKIFLSKYSRSIKIIASTTFFIIASLLPYTDVFLDFFIDTQKIKMNRFPNLAAAIWSYSMPISNLLVLYIAKKFNPWWPAYIFPIYVNITMLCGFLFLDLNINIDSVWLFRGVTLSISLLLFATWKLYLDGYFKTHIAEDRVDYEIKKLTELNDDQGKA
ncbi:hypothetical protein [Chryseobacterium sp. ZHDP1]|uniref:hypothetical protein n=1 Tax=Chryseobacterium sp. ZHDP1 TaxID=2838877 RepID=UPI001BE0DF54|nr:hypothetical protein [Chryseobacterium sp. ZHDP1]QWA38841.1 hypothetical protein KKI44_01105 [Chryseobacterium sp. ZHDP1]